MVWRVEFEPKAEKQFGKLDPSTRDLIAKYLYRRVQGLDDPRSLGKALRHDKSGLWRYRVDKYRIICQIKDEVLTILVLEVGKRDRVCDD